MESNTIMMIKKCSSIYFLLDIYDIKKKAEDWKVISAGIGKTYKKKYKKEKEMEAVRLNGNK